MMNKEKPRRDFLLKSMALIVLSSVCGSSAFADVFSYPKFSGLRIFHGRKAALSTSLDGVVQEVSGELCLRFSTNPIDGLQDVSEASSSSLLHLSGLLFGRNCIKQIDNFSPERIAQFKGVYVNSNGAKFSSEFGEVVLPYRLIEDKGVRIGIMGISFHTTSQSLSDILAQMTNTAKTLKDKERCLYVLCLTECPKEVFPEYSLRELAENSNNIDQFLATSDQFKNDKLYVLRSKLGNQVLLHQKSQQSDALNLTQMTKNMGFRHSELMPN